MESMRKYLIGPDTVVTQFKVNCLSVSVVSGQRARLEIQGSRVQTRLKSIFRMMYNDTYNPESNIKWEILTRNMLKP